MVEMFQVCENGHRLIESDHPESDTFGQNIQDLLENLAHLKQNLEARNAKLLVSEKAQQFFFDANEAEAWMSEQELYMMVEDRGKDEFSAQNLMKKHDALDAAVDDYSNNVRQLGEAARQLIAEGHPDSEQIGVRLAQVHTSFNKFLTFSLIYIFHFSFKFHRSNTQDLNSQNHLFY